LCYTTDADADADGDDDDDDDTNAGDAVVGGFDDNAPLDCVERYDPVNNTWSTVISMSCPRGGVGVAALGGRLYAVGGHDGSNYLSSVEEYDPCTDRCPSALCLCLSHAL